MASNTARRPQFSIADIPVRVEPAFFVIIALLGINPIEPNVLYIGSWVAIAFVSILLHELGHAFAFKRYGAQPSISLHGFGGLTSASADLSPAKHIVVSLAGPLSALVLLGLPALWLEQTGTLTSVEATTIVSQVVWINIGWSLLNLVPVLPLDGGQVFLAVANMVTRGNGARVAQIISVLVAGGLGLWAVANGLIFGAVLAAMFAGINVTALSREKGIELGLRLQDAQRALLAHRPIDAQALVDAVLAGRPSGETLRWAAELGAWARLWQGDAAGAREALARYAHAGPPSTAFRAAMAMAVGQHQEGVSLMAWSFVHEPPGPAISLGTVAAAGSGCALDVARELVLLGPKGVEGARVFQQLLEHTGYRQEAGDVGRLLPAAPWPTAGH